MREINYAKLLGIFAITTLLFLSGFMLSKSLTESKLGELEQAIQDITLQTASIETEYTLLLENPCSFAGFNRLTASLDELASKLLFNNVQQHETQARLDSIRRNYFLLETKHWMFVQKLNEECGTNYTSILYFYSDKGDCDVCEGQGIVLSEIKKTHPNVMIYSYDVNADYSLVDTLRTIYDIKTVPSLVIDGEVYDKFLTQDDLEKILAKKSKIIANETAQACNVSNASNSTVA